MKQFKFHFLFLFLIFSTTVIAQINVTGTVVDEKGEPLIGVRVLVKGTAQGTVTDFNGKFGVNVAKPSDVLVF